MFDSLLLLTSWLTALCLGHCSTKNTALKFLALNVLSLALLVELSAVLQIGTLVTNNLGASAGALCAMSSVASIRLGDTFTKPLLPTRQRRRSAFLWLLAATPLLSLIGLRFLDGVGMSAWLDVDLRSFAGAEDNAKWIGATSALRVGEPPGIQAIGGFLVVALRGSLALADALSVLGLRPQSTELGSVLFATQFVREVLVAGSPFLVLLLFGNHQAPRSHLNLALPFVLMVIITQGVAMQFGFLSFQSALFVGSFWTASLKHRSYRERSWQLVSLLSGAVFLLSWLPLRLFLPIYVALAIPRISSYVPKVLKVIFTVVATGVSFDTLRYVLAIDVSSLEVDADRPLQLLEASGGVFSISPYLVILAVMAAAATAVDREESLRLPNEAKSLLAYGVVVQLADLLLNGRLGYGSTKLLFLVLALLIVFGIAILSQIDLSSRAHNFAATICLGLSLLVVSSYGYGLWTWGVHARAVVTTTRSDISQDQQSSRLRDPLLVLSDYQDLRNVLERERVCSDQTCNLGELPRFCLAVYSETRKALMQPRAVTRINSLSSGEIDEYLCTRFLTELSRGRISNGALQAKLFFATQDRLRDSLTWIAQHSPDTKVLVAHEGRNQLEIVEVSRLAVLSRQLYPDAPYCKQDFGTVDRNVNCQR